MDELGRLLRVRQLAEAASWLSTQARIHQHDRTSATDRSAKTEVKSGFCKADGRLIFPNALGLIESQPRRPDAATQKRAQRFSFGVSVLTSISKPGSPSPNLAIISCFAKRYGYE